MKKKGRTTRKPKKINKVKSKAITAPGFELKQQILSSFDPVRILEEPQQAQQAQQAQQGGIATDRNDGQGHIIQSKLYRRSFIKLGISGVILGSIGSFLGAVSSGTIGQILGSLGVDKQIYENNRQRSLSELIQAYAIAIRESNTNRAVEASLQIHEKINKDASETLKWVNNFSCALVRYGEIDRAYEVLSGTLESYLSIPAYTISASHLLILQSNYLWVLYLYVGSKRLLSPYAVDLAKRQILRYQSIKNVKEIMATQSNRDVEGIGWYRLWEPKNYGEEKQAIYPFGVLGRIQLLLGEYKPALDSFRQEMILQGNRPVRGAIIGAWQAMRLGMRNDAVDIIKKVSFDSMEQSLYDHLNPLAALIIGHAESTTKNRTIFHDPILANQSLGSLSSYFAWSAAADLSIALGENSDNIRSLSIEYGGHLSVAYDKLANESSQTAKPLQHTRLLIEKLKHKDI